MMQENAAGLAWAVVGGYAAIGACVWLALLAGAFARIDAAAQAAPLRVKALLLAGALALWPVLLVRLAGVRPREDQP